MITKLKMKVSLFDTVFIENSIPIKSYWIKIAIIDKDKRFEASENSDLKHGSNFYISSEYQNKWGSISDTCLALPALNRTGFDYNKEFLKEEDRHIFLKNLYTAIEEWSNYWWGFVYDGDSKIILNDDTWNVVCENIYDTKLCQYEY